MNNLSSDSHIIRSKRFRAVLALVLCAVIAVTFLPAARETLSAATKLTDSKVQNYEDRLAQIEKEMNNLKSQIATSKKDYESAMQDKKNLDTEIELMLKKIDVQKELVEALSLSIEETAGQIGEKQDDYNKKYELFKERLRVTYEDGDASYIEILFGSESLADFLVRVDRIGAMLEYDTKIMNELKNEKSSLEETKATLETTKQNQANLLNQLMIDEAALQVKADEAEFAILKLQNDTKNYENLVAKNQKLREEIDAELTKYLKELEAQQTAKYVGGTFMWPVPLSWTVISSECGWRTSPINGKQEFHNGIDIPAPFGTDVYAANSGTVIKATYHYSYGNYIMIDHGGGYVTLYAHNSKLLVSVGDKVTKGQVIAKVGSTGDSTGNHCHFSVYLSGEIVNPREFFKS